MSTMSKPRKSQKKDRHKSGRMVRLPDDVAGLMEELARENDRPLTRELRQACIAWLTAKGKWPPASST